jgi:chemotaxis protein CheD
MEVVRVGIAEGEIVRAPNRIRTTGLGSCVGVVIFDSLNRLAGMVHIMLPIAPQDTDVNEAKYADTGIPWLCKRLMQSGARPSHLKAKIAGGAQMFAFAAKTEMMRVGPRNIEAVHSTLSDLHIPITASDVGGSIGRTIEFDVCTETLVIRTAQKGTYFI